MDEYINTKKTKEMLGVTVKTLRVWDKEGKIRTTRLPSGQLRYNLQDVNDHLGLHSSPMEKEKICYCRVSSSKQMDDLERQKDFFRQKYPTHRLVTDIGSGINWKRKGLKTLLDGAMQRNITEIVVAHRDRLCRFAFDLLEGIFNSRGIKLLVLDQDKEKSSDSELSDDILSIIHVYSCRQMGRRRYKIKKTETVSDSRTKEDNEGMDGDQEIRVQ